MFSVETAPQQVLVRLLSQIFSVARQALSLVAGGAIDVFLAGQLRLLQQEHTLARAIHGVQAALWPGGVWFMQRPEYRKKPVSFPADVSHKMRNEPIQHKY